MSYRILRTDKASDQLFDLIQYIAADAGAETALRYLDKLEVAILNLAHFPYSGTVPRYSTLKKQGYRVLIVERHLVFYKVDVLCLPESSHLSWTLLAFRVELGGLGLRDFGKFFRTWVTLLPFFEG